MCLFTGVYGGVLVYGYTDGDVPTGFDEDVREVVGWNGSEEIDVIIRRHSYYIPHPNNTP